MSRADIPDWCDMPEDTPISTLCWQDVYTYAADELDRAPTKQEVRDLFDSTAERISDVTGESFSEDLMDVIYHTVSDLLKEKPYNPEQMNNEELTSKKYCHECIKVQETYWELNYCEKNPQGIDVFTGNHGNDNTCEDGYCNPESATIESKDITVQYIKEHAVYERCVTCHQYFDSMVQSNNK